LIPSVGMASTGIILSKSGKPLSASFDLSKSGKIENASSEIYKVFGIKESPCLKGASITGKPPHFVVTGKQACKENSVPLIVSVSNSGAKTFEEIKLIRKTTAPAKKKKNPLDSKSEKEKSKLTWMGQRGDGYYYFKTGDTLMRAAYIIRSKTYLEKGPTAISKCLYDGSVSSFIDKNPNKVKAGSTVRIIDAVNCEVTYEDAYAFFSSFDRMEKAKSDVSKLNARSRGPVLSKLSKKGKNVIAAEPENKYTARVAVGAVTGSGTKKPVKVLSPAHARKHVFSDASEIAPEEPIDHKALLDKTFSDPVIAGILPSKSNGEYKRYQAALNEQKEVKDLLKKQISERDERIITLNGEIKQIRKTTTAKITSLTEKITKLTKENYMLYAAILSILVSIITFLIAWNMHKRGSNKRKEVFTKVDVRDEEG